MPAYISASDCCYTSGTGNALTNTTWGNWIVTATNSASTITNTIWTDWASNASAATGIFIVSGNNTPEPSAEQRAVWARQQEENRVRAEAANKLRIESEAKAEALLLSALSQRQREEYRREQAFMVFANSGIRYRIRKGRVANVDVLHPDGNTSHRLCAHPHDVPDCDTMLAQKLMLECCEDEFLRIANRHH